MPLTNELKFIQIRKLALVHIQHGLSHRRMLTKSQDHLWNLQRNLPTVWFDLPKLSYHMHCRRTNWYIVVQLDVFTFYKRYYYYHCSVCNDHMTIYRIRCVLGKICYCWIYHTYLQCGVALECYNHFQLFKLHIHWNVAPSHQYIYAIIVSNI